MMLSSKSSLIASISSHLQNPAKTLEPKLDHFWTLMERQNPSPEFAAESLRRKYDSVFAQPRDTWKVEDAAAHFDADSNATGLQDIAFSAADIERACADLRGSAAAGPAGVPAILLKNCRKLLSKPLHSLWRASVDSGSIPDELLLVLICPVHKGSADLSQKLQACCSYS
jgi:hypothetical protein